jgi:hypothetical protein
MVRLHQGQPNFMKNEVPTNIYAPVIEVNHYDLELAGDSVYKVFCPVCKKGLLLVSRNNYTMEIKELDRCVLCGQRVKYKDVERLKHLGQNPTGSLMIWREE